MNAHGSAVHNRRARALATLFVVAVACASPISSALAQCVISGPDNVDEGGRFTLCAPSGYTYRWSGPGVPGGVTSRCITISGRPTGLYEYRVSLYASGVYRNQCTHSVTVGEAPYPPPAGGGSTGGGSETCVITGPDTFEPGTRVRLCGPSGVTDYRWTGPGGFYANSSCVSVGREGTYVLNFRDRFGALRQCTHYLDTWQGPDDSEQPISENCPRTYAFWAAVSRGSRTDVTAAELRSIARRVDEMSEAFGWADDAGGLSQALRPPSPLTQRKQATRQLAALLANVAAAELGITDHNGQVIGVDPETPIRFRNARTVGELSALVDRMLARGRGSYAQANTMLQSVNNGRGIGAVCQ
jgi:hypothetical protein